MAEGIIPDEGLAGTLLRTLNPAGVSPGSWRLILWVNDLTPDKDTVVADLVPATWLGYSFVTLDQTKWTAPDVSDGCATSYYDTAPLVWWVTGGPTETNYGYALIDTGPNVIRFVQRFDDSDLAPVVPGSRVVLLPTYTITSAACPGSEMVLAAARRSRRRKKRA